MNSDKYYPKAERIVHTLVKPTFVSRTWYCDVYLTLMHVLVEMRSQLSYPDGHSRSRMPDEKAHCYSPFAGSDMTTLLATLTNTDIDCLLLNVTRAARMQFG